MTAHLTPTCGEPAASPLGQSAEETRQLAQAWIVGHAAGFCAGRARSTAAFWTGVLAGMLAVLAAAIGGWL